MFGSEVLDVAIGLTFVYLVLGLITSAINEMLEAALRRRASFLQRGLREMLGDPQGSGLVRSLYNHPLVNSLFPGPYNPKSNRNLPSYIPARNFSLALMDTIALSNRNSGQRSGAARSTVAYSDLQGAGPAQGAASPAGSGLRAAAESARVSHPEASQAILTLLDAAGDDPGKTRENIEAWFNSTMDRVSGAYKRGTQIMLLASGLFIAVLMNADSINIVTSLATNEAVRQTLVTASAAAPAGSSDALLVQIRRSGLPVGWSPHPMEHDPRGVPATWGEWFAKVLGLLLTGFAVSLGAPFWFDVLNRIIVVRSTIKPHEKSPEEPAKA